MTSGGSRQEKRITLYTTPTCYWCRVAKAHLLEHSIPFREIDVTKDRRGLREMVLMTGRHAVPVIRVGEHAMTGWDEAEFERLRAGGLGRR